MGASPAPEGGARFRVWAPAAQSVELQLSDRRFPLEAEGDGVWSGWLRDAHVGSRYWYVLNGELKRSDPYSRSQPEGVHGPSEIVDPDAFEWHDQVWHGVGSKGLVIYQTHVGTATSEGTLDSLIQELPRLSILGVTAVQLLPLAEFPGQRNWGYDGVDLFTVSRNYGGPQALKRFVDAAHALQLGVILDVVYNHFGPDGNYLRDFSPDYFTDRYHTPWGDALNFDGPYSSWVRKLVIDNARYWLNEYHADGLRLDATHAIFDGSPRHVLAELTQEGRASVGADRQIVLIAETGENDVRYLRPVGEGGLGFDAVYADDFHHSLRRYLAGDHEGYYASFEGTLEELARCIEQGWLRGKPAPDRPAWQFLYVIQNHDQVGNRPFGDRLNQQIDTERFKAGVALLLFLPFTPMLFMGQEFGASTPFQYFTDHNPELGRLVTEGRRREFKAFSAFADPKRREAIPDPQAESTFLNSKLHTEEAQHPPGSEMIAWHQSLLYLRRSDPVLSDQARERMEPAALTDDVLAVRRWRDQDERLLLVNFGDLIFATGEFGGGWRVVLQSCGGPIVGDEQVGVAPRSAKILARP